MHVEDCVSRCKQCQFDRKKHIVDPVASNSGALAVGVQHQQKRLRFLGLTCALSFDQEYREFVTNTQHCKISLFLFTHIIFIKNVLMSKQLVCCAVDIRSIGYPQVLLAGCLQAIWQTHFEEENGRI